MYEILPQFRSVALIALGSNRPSPAGDARETVHTAVTIIGQTLGANRAASRLFRTPAFPPGSGPEFVNAAVATGTNMAPAEVIAALHAIEAEFARERRKRWAPRTLDLDLIALDDMLLPDAETHRRWRDLPLDAQMEEAPSELLLPHPRVQERAFVLVPLAEVAPDWVHPALGLSVREMLEGLPEALKNEVSALD